MSQFLLPVIQPASHDGNDLAGFLNSWRDPVINNHSGAARPSYAVRGMLWVKTSGSEDTIYYFNGTNDVLLFQIDSSGAIISGGGGGGTGAITFKGSIDPTVSAPVSTNGDYYISDTAGEIHSSFVGIAGETGSATDILIYDGALWSRIANTVDLSAYMPLAGGTMTGPLILSQDPVAPLEAATRQWVLGLGTGDALPVTGGTLTGPLVLPADPVNPLEAATMQYVDAGDALALPLAGGTMTGPLLLSGAPTASNGAATKNYVETWHDTSKLNVAGGTMTGPLTLATNAMAALEPVTLQQFETGTQSVQVSTGSPSGNKLVRTNAIGKIDNSLLQISTGFTYGGQLDPTATAPSNINGYYYILNADGTFDASFGAPVSGVAGAVGDIVISNGVSWEISPVSSAGTSYVDRDTSNMLGTSFQLLAGYAAPTTMIDGTDSDLALLANVGIPGGVFGMPNNKVGLVYSDSAGGAPAVSDLSDSALGLNRADLKLYALDSADTVRSLLTMPRFSALGSYASNELAVNSNRLIRARGALTAGAFDAADWDDLTPGVAEYNASAVYMLNNLCAYAGDVYRCLADDTGPEAFTPSNWELISAAAVTGIVNGTSNIDIPVVDDDVIVTVAGTERVRFDDDGLLLTQGGVGENMLRYKSQSQPPHPFTTIASSDIYAFQRIGGAGQLNTYTLSDDTYSCMFFSYTGDDSVIANRGAFTFNAAGSDGAGAGQPKSDTSNVFVLNNQTSPIVTIKGNGDLLIEGELTTENGTLTAQIAAATGSISANKIENGTSKVEIPAVDGAVKIKSNDELYGYFGGDEIVFYKFISFTTAGNTVAERIRTGVAHPFTSVAAASTYGQTFTSATGGITESGFAAGSTGAFNWLGHTQTPTTNGLGGVFQLVTRKSDGGTGQTALAANDDAFNILNNGASLLLLKGNGDLEIAGKLNAGFTEGNIVTGDSSGNIVSNPIINWDTGLEILEIGTSSYLTRFLGTLNTFNNGANFLSGITVEGGVDAAGDLTVDGDIYAQKTSAAITNIKALNTNGGFGLTLPASGLYGDLALYDSAGTYINTPIRAYPGAAVQLFHGANLSLNTSAIGISIIGTINQYKTTSSNTVHNLYNTVDGGLQIGANGPTNYYFATVANNLGVLTYDIVVTKSDGNVSLRHGGVNKLRTASTGIEVDGDANVTGQVVDYTKFNNQSGTTYTAILSDASKIIWISNAAANTITIPANASVAYPVGTKLNFVQGGAGKTTIAIAGADVIRINDNFTANLSGQYAIATAVKTSATTWLLYGNLEPV